MSFEDLELEALIPQLDLRARILRLLEGGQISVAQFQAAGELSREQAVAGFVSGEGFCALASLSDLGDLSTGDSGEILREKILKRLQEMLEVYVW